MPLGQVACDIALQLALLSAVLGQLHRTEAIGERGKASAGVDRGKLDAVTDEDQARRAPGRRVGETLEGARRHHRGLVHHDDAVARDGLVLSPLDSAQEERGGLGGDPRLALQQIGGLALPGDTDHRDTGALVGVAQRGEGEGLAGAGSGLHHPHAILSGCQVAHRSLLISAEPRAIRDHRLDSSGVRHDGPVRIAAGGRVEQAHLGAEHVGGGEEHLAVAAAGVIACARQDDACPRQEVVGQVLEVSGGRALGVDLGQPLDHLAPGEGRALVSQALGSEHVPCPRAKALGVVGGRDHPATPEGAAKLVLTEAVLVTSVKVVYEPTR